MTVAERAKMYEDYLAREGYRPTVEDGGTLIRFKHNGGNYYLVIDERDEQFFQLIYPNFWSIESEPERDKAVRSADRATAQCKVAKVYLRSDDTNVMADAEEFLDSPRSFEAIFPRSVQSVERAVQVFVEEMNKQ